MVASVYVVPGSAAEVLTTQRLSTLTEAVRVLVKVQVTDSRSDRSTAAVRVPRFVVAEVSVQVIPVRFQSPAAASRIVVVPGGTW